MAKYTNKLADKIVELYRTGEHTIPEICEAVGIGRTSFFHWRNTKSNFSDALKKVEDERYENIGEMALGGLRKLVQGFEYEEKTVIKRVDQMGKLNLFEEKTITKVITPSAGAVVKALTSLKKSRFKDEKDVNLNGDTGVNLIINKKYDNKGD